MSTGKFVAVLDPATARQSIRLRPNGRIFYRDGQPWRWMGISMFPLMDRYARGDNIAPLFNSARGCNVLRVWSYVTWDGTGWETPSLTVARQFIQRCADEGFYVYLTLMTDDAPARYQPARDLAHAVGDLPNVIFECGNEPHIHKNIDVWALQEAVEQTGAPYASGENEMLPFIGSLLDAHTPRDSEWPRKCHDLLEYYNGGGPGAPTDPPHPVPCVSGEPIRPDEASYVATDFRAYFGGCAILGAGGTFHYEGGKHGVLPTPDERRCLDAALHGLGAFPPDAPLGGYRRIDEGAGSLRTYVVGERYMVRIRPTTLIAPEPGWSSLDADGILWRKA